MPVAFIPFESQVIVDTNNDIQMTEKLRVLFLITDMEKVAPNAT